MITGHRQEILQLLERLSELTGIRAGHNENGPLNRRSGSLRRTSLKPIRTVEEMFGPRRFNPATAYNPLTMLSRLPSSVR